MLIACSDGMSFSSQSWPSRMRSGHGVVLVVIQSPDRSTWPSGLRGAGALRFGLPFGSCGTSGVLIVIHWAATTAGSAIHVRRKAQRLITSRVYPKQKRREGRRYPPALPADPPDPALPAYSRLRVVRVLRSPSCPSCSEVE